MDDQRVSHVRLPVELITAIVVFLCPQCTPGPERTCINPECPDKCKDPGDDRSRIAALSRVCLASQMLNSIATPHLYHRPTCGRWWLLCRTLEQRPRLALHVKHLSDAFWEDEPDSGSEVSASRGGEGTLYSRQGSPSDEAPLEWTWPVWYPAENTDLEALLEVCHNLEELDIRISCHGIFSRVSQRCGGVGLPHLRVAKLADYDNGRGAWRDDCLDLGHLQSLLHLAPNLACIVLREFHAVGLGDDEEGRAELPNCHLLADFRLHSCHVEKGALLNMLDSMPNLRHLSLEPGHGGSAWTDVGSLIPCEMQHIIYEVPHLEHLRSLHLDLPRYDLFRWTNPVNVEDLVDDLTDLEQLEHVVLDIYCLVPEYWLIKTGDSPEPEASSAGSEHAPWRAQRRRIVHGPERGPHPNAMLLVDMLPPSIRTVEITRRSFSRKFEDVREQVRQLAFAPIEKLPRLERVTLSGVEEEDFEAERMVFEWKQITFVVNRDPVGRMPDE